ncbi:hypothetical protein CKAH01_06716 [Colletotrichum kahawae]|uniref:Uncharacterized protein n=1 Tax=Colletotrichum kahawae TaxID=34407 RepID=A0AAD9Y9A8_COLKA|nr:hypothetical protein CKAH01_06716 [Colletotrichum kahawae]
MYTDCRLAAPICPTSKTYHPRQIHPTMDSETQRMRTERLSIVTDLGSPPILKEAQSCCSEEPPAYAPTMKPSIIDSLAAYLSRHSDPYGTAPHRVAPCPEVSFSSQFSDDDHEELSPISLRISTRINVTCDGNLIALPSSPSDQANSIAKAVVKAIQGQDWATGLPMIDENGRPRPLKLDVDAGMTIKGSSNVIGTESIINEIIRQRTITRNWTPPSPSRSTESPATTSPSSPKRRRRLSDAAPLEQTRGKRARHDV